MSLLLLLPANSPSAQTYSESLVAALSFTDSLAVRGVFSTTLSESFTLADSFTSKQVFSSQLAAGLTLLDSLDSKASYVSALIDTTAFSDSQSSRSFMASGLSESTVMGFSAGASHVQIAAFSTSISLVEAMDGIRYGVVWPAPVEVLLGIKYGPTGADFTGTAAASGSPSGFASRMSVTLTTEQLSVVEKPRKTAPQAAANTPAQRNPLKNKNVYVNTSIPQRHVLTPPYEIWVRTNKETI